MLQRHCPRETGLTYHHSIPLCFIYPPMLHLKACARTRTEKALDYLLIAFGVIVGLYTTVQTIRSLFDSSSSELPRSGKCDVPSN